MELHSLRRTMEFLLLIVIPAVILFLPIPLILESYRYLILLILLLILIFSIIIFVFSEEICKILWKSGYKEVLRQSLIGIIKEEGCPAKATSLTPGHWKRIMGRNWNVRYITVSEISSEFVAIINPYGECYPEVDMLKKTSFNKIKEYVKNGGIFVNTAGLAFWYGWNKLTIGTPSTAREVYSFGGMIKVGNLSKLEPVYNMPPALSLTETLTFQEFGLLSTTGIPTLTQVFQANEDKDFCGDIEDVGETNEILEFRAIREPIQSCIPMLRTKIKIGNSTYPVYPLACVPYERGKFIFTGMVMEPRSEINTMGDEPRQITPTFLQDIIKSQSKKVCKGLKNIINNKKEEFGIS